MIIVHNNRLSNVNLLRINKLQTNHRWFIDKIFHLITDKENKF